MREERFIGCECLVERRGTRREGAPQDAPNQRGDLVLARELEPVDGGNEVRPWISKTADRNFIETLSFVSNFSRTAEKNPQGIERLSTRLATVDEPTRSQLVALCFRTAERYAKHEEPIGPSGALLAQKAFLPVDTR